MPISGGEDLSQSLCTYYEMVLLFIYKTVEYLPIQSLPLTIWNILSQFFLFGKLLGHIHPNIGDWRRVCQDPWQDCLKYWNKYFFKILKLKSVFECFTLFTNMTQQIFSHDCNLTTSLFHIAKPMDNYYKWRYHLGPKMG